MCAMSTQVQHQPDNSRFVIMVDGQEAGLALYQESQGVRDFHHTEIYPQFQGQGLSSPLIKAALEDTKNVGLKIKPTCSAVEHFLSKEANAQFRALIAD
ncbi:N-acetyltransferase [Corynebacterium sp. 3HC-13]|nr:N-acetyltransferase [Corynebacterium poyangense]